jgi:TRAP transporter TAXI family solute receptor
MSELAHYLPRVLPEYDFHEAENPGAVATIDAIQRGVVDFGLVGADVAYLAYVGALPGTSPGYDRLRAVAVHRSNAFHVVVRPHSGIRRFADLSGHTIGIGPSSSGTAQFAPYVFKSFDIDLTRTRIETLPFDLAAQRLTAQTMDAFVQFSSYESEAVDVATKAGAFLLSVEGPQTERLRAEYPFVRVVTIPAGMYPGQHDIIRTLGVDNLVICRRDLPPQWVFDVTKQLFNALPNLTSLRQPIGGTDASRAAGTPIPLHEGAIRYFREQELFR